jgi:hypothetical protein
LSAGSQSRADRKSLVRIMVMMLLAVRPEEPESIVETPVISFQRGPFIYVRPKVTTCD